MNLEAQEMARLLKERNNKSFEPIVLGNIASTDPLKVIDNNGFILDTGDELIITYHIQQLINRGELINGNIVCMVSTSDYSKYVVIDKVV